MTEEEERILIGKCLKNDRASQEELYRLFCDKMYGVCMYYAEDRDEASDFLQDGFITVFGKLHMFKFKGSLEGWVRRIVVNTALSVLRKKKRLKEVSGRVEELADIPEEIIEIEEVPTAKIISMVNDLPSKASLVLKLFAIEGYSHQEIAEILDISIGTSKSQLNRARTLLKIELAKS